jgi:4-hydroxy-tetrahydrodipicolinate synthase
MFEGTYPAIATPFSDGDVDESSLRHLVRHLVEQGVDGIVACGTTGESPTLTLNEWRRVVGICVEESGGKPVIVGTGSNSTRDTVARTSEASQLGAAAALVVVPYYNKPTQEGMKQHFMAVATEGRLPVILYNVPSRTGVNMAPETAIELSSHSGIVGIKEASGSLDQASAIMAGVPDGFSVLSGDDSLCMPMYALGGHGTISTTANVVPGHMCRMYLSVQQGQLGTAQTLHHQLFPLFGALFAESNPIPLKYALCRLGLIRNELRLPLLPAGNETEELVDLALMSLGML